MDIHTALSKIDGERGTLEIAGCPVGTLPSFEAVCARLLDQSEDAVVDGLKRGREIGLRALRVELKDPMDALRASVARLELSDPLELIGALGALVTRGIGRGSTSATGHAAALLEIAELDVEHAPALDAYLKTVVDHGLNASTFTARVIASTRADLVSAVTGAIGALKGPLHGGAPGPVLDMLDAAGSTENEVRAWILAELDAGRRIMGMGHRVYRVRDPRAAVLENAALTLGSPQVARARLVEKVAEEVLRAKKPGRPLKANVEFFTAVLLDAISIPRAHFTPIFASARVAGWCAHILEERARGRLIRPRAAATQ